MKALRRGRPGWDGPCSDRLTRGGAGHADVHLDHAWQARLRWDAGKVAVRGEDARPMTSRAEREAERDVELAPLAGRDASRRAAGPRIDADQRRRAQDRV